MKKSVLTFCTVLLLATQAPVANAEGGNTEAKAKYFQSASEYQLQINAANFKIQWPFENIKIGDIETIIKTFPKPEVKPVPKPETKPEVKPVPKPETKPEVKPVPKPETKPEVKPVPKPETKPEVKPVPKPETKPEVKPVPKPETKPEQKPTTPPNQVTDSEKPNQPGNNTNDADVAAIEKQVVELTNKERAKFGLAALEMDQPLMAAAREKSQDMKNNNYFSHTSPTFGSPFDRMKALGISYKSAGENIAKGQTSAAQVVEAWMNSEGHRANILNKDFTHIGVGYVKSGNIWTQQFIKK
ncbi:CAP domain-containing protein [Solibacillus sp. MA9]|uniref:CAP domain-containing protein n=1 Tax=Solibacillus palustris TaxID=2908203 RepID=A0ABS9UER5_9BACL|nr:CAP domain-containing protein [Solibacillus sp. MA9]MCH7322620.1 CAP domain-containing protein [Solibacillus sp. MA9]